MDRPTDTQLLDFLQKSTTGYGLGWIVRRSTTGRGMRIHETSNNGDSDISILRQPDTSIRNAIFKAMCDEEDEEAKMEREDLPD